MIVAELFVFRKRCMDLVSFETRAEYEWVKERLGGTQFFWTSGQAVHRVHYTPAAPTAPAPESLV
jgi:hypothetical protein